MRRRIYLAGPEVFLGDAQGLYAAKKQLCDHEAARYTDLSGFERCLQQAKSLLAVRPDGRLEWLPWKLGRGGP